MRSRSIDYPISKILLIGESAWRPELRTALKDALARASDGGSLPPPEPTSLPPGQQRVIANDHRHQPEQKGLLRDKESVAKAVDQAAAAPMADPQLLSSRGAAVFARRRQETPNACQEPSGCRKDKAEGPNVGPARSRMKLALRSKLLGILRLGM